MVYLPGNGVDDCTVAAEWLVCDGFLHLLLTFIISFIRIDMGESLVITLD